MSAYSKRWVCEVCGDGCESMERPAVAVCDGCEARLLRGIEPDFRGALVAAFQRGWTAAVNAAARSKDTT